MLDINRLQELEVCLLPCIFEDGSYSVIDKEGNRRGRIKREGEYWVAIFMKQNKGKCKKIEEAVRLLLL